MKVPMHSLVRPVPLANGGAGSDQLVGGAGLAQQEGGDGDDFLWGDVDGLAALDQGADVMSGGAGNNTLFGDSGDDILIGGAGMDILVGTGHWCCHQKGRATA